MVPIMQSAMKTTTEEVTEAVDVALEETMVTVAVTMEREMVVSTNTPQNKR